jgi:hypothetical protein
MVKVVAVFVETVKVVELICEPYIFRPKPLPPLRTKVTEVEIELPVPIDADCPDVPSLASGAKKFE